MTPQQKKSMHIASRARSIGYAFHGLVQLVKQEPNAHIHIMATIAAIIAGCIRHISPIQWAAITIVIAIVWATEALNTCIEKLCNIWCQGKLHSEIKIIKDIAAGAVLISAVASVITGIIVFFF